MDYVTADILEVENPVLFRVASESTVVNGKRLAVVCPALSTDAVSKAVASSLYYGFVQCTRACSAVGNIMYVVQQGREFKAAAIDSGCYEDDNACCTTIAVADASANQSVA